MPIGIKKLINKVLLDDDPTSITGLLNLRGITSQKISFYISVVESGSPSAVTFSVDVSPDQGVTLLRYDKLRTETDSVQAEQVYAADAEDVISMSPEDAAEYIVVSMVGAGTGANDTYLVSVWGVYNY